MTPPLPGAPDLPGLSSLSPLGRGGFADVYLAHQVHLGRWVAAKVFRVALADRQANEQFRAECQAVGRLHGHPSVITVYEANVLPDGRPYMVTEHCDGSLHQLVQANGRLTASRLTDIGLTVARALLFAHSSGVLHGDVTPQNILLRASGAPVLADFGLAVLRDHQGNTATGFTMAHAAPETVRHDGAIDERTDVYGLGSTLYTALTGRPPVPGRPGEEDAARAHRILTETPLQPPGAPPGLARLLLSMLAKDPDARPSMTDVADALSAMLDGAPASPANGGAAREPGPSPPSGPLDPDLGPSYLAPDRAPAAPRAGTWDAPSPPESGTGPRWSAPSGVGAPPTGSGEDTRLRAAAGAFSSVAPGGEQTRVRPRPDQPAAGLPAPGRRPRWLLPVVAGAVVLLLAGIGVAVFQPFSTGNPADAPPAAAGDAITLAQPVDRGDTVELTWTAGTTMDFAVIVGAQGTPPATSLVNRVTTYTVPVEAGKPYCFRVQGSSPTGAVSQSNVAAIRGAVCRFDQ